MTIISKNVFTVFIANKTPQSENSKPGSPEALLSLSRHATAAPSFQLKL